QAQEFGLPGMVLSGPTLLNLEGVQEELRLTTAQREAYKAITEEYRQKARRLASDVKENAGRLAARDALLAGFEAATQANLTPEQRRRLDQVRVQVMGPSGFVVRNRGPEALGVPLAERLKLTDDQVRQLHEVVTQGVQDIVGASSFPLALDATNGP